MSFRIVHKYPGDKTVGTIFAIPEYKLIKRATIYITKCMLLAVSFPHLEDRLTCVGIFLSYFQDHYFVVQCWELKVVTFCGRVY